ncbi:MAG: D-alanine--D-alanine ligase [Fusobacterium sp.]|uniref:D-alanine--D-alanine ligase family protein n=1 Tax=Fusobacterium sp. TaxID=68766 RepID=UPI0026DC0FC3|nr:D-alanine--D-alanine ligase [Fusobacterium sp.]MDO4690989.1 D-alanine--D-alanine ligase [Fusobacterium sp.]
MKIAVFMGGKSSEREVSLRSGKAVLASLKRQGFDAYGVELEPENEILPFLQSEYDLAYLVLHGGNGENGKIQSILDILGKKYTGSGVLASAITMDKRRTKMIAESMGIKTPATFDKIEEIDRYPVIVKPVDEGSSVGLHVCTSLEEVKKAVKQIEKPIIEEYIKGEELTVGVMNDRALGVLKIIPKAAEIYDYDSKYKVGGSIHEYPAKIDNQIYKKIMLVAENIHKEFGMKGISRSDFIMKDNEVYFLEVNSSPGMTETSLIPDLATLQGYTFDDIIKTMVETFSK